MGIKLQKKFIKKNFQKLSIFLLKDISLIIVRRKNQGFAILMQLPKFINRIIKEKKTIEKISFEENIDIIISDNRFGLRSKRTTNIYITHQINIMGPLLITKLINAINRKIIGKFDHTWIPDFENSELSGGLSENKLNCLNIGPLSRFENYKNDDSKILFKYLAIISGPENQRSLLEKEIKNCFLKSNYQCAIINGKQLAKKN